MSRPTLRDVAQRAGVSLGTASQALNNKEGVAPITRARVLNAAASLNYQQQIRVPSARVPTLTTAIGPQLIVRASVSCRKPRRL